MKDLKSLKNRCFVCGKSGKKFGSVVFCKEHQHLSETVNEYPDLLDWAKAFDVQYFLSNYRNEPGICPLCHSDHLVYSKGVIEGINVVFRWVCKSCKTKGKEIYELNFQDNLVE